MHDLSIDFIRIKIKVDPKKVSKIIESLSGFLEPVKTCFGPPKSNMYTHIKKYAITGK